MKKLVFALFFAISLFRSGIGSTVTAGADDFIA